MMKRSLICCIIMSAIFWTSVYSSGNEPIINTETKEFPKSKDLKRGYPNSESIQAIDIQCQFAAITGICVSEFEAFIPPAITTCADQTITITADPIVLFSGTANCIGAIYQITYTATDNCGQPAAVCTQDFELVAPTITCPVDQSGLDCEDDLPDGATTIVDFIAAGGTIDGDCDDEFTIAFVDSPDPSNLDFCSGVGLVITRTYSITDACGTPVTTNCTQTFTYNTDTTPPTASDPAMITINCSTAPAPDPAVVIDEADNCVTMPTVAFVSDVSDGNTCPEVITRTYSITDGCGNSTTVQQTINLDDTMVPVLTCPSNLVLECDGDYEDQINTWLATASATDGCSAVTITNDYTVGSLPAISCDQSTGLTVTFNATDDCDNMAEPCTATIILDDNVAPVITCPADIEVACGSDTSSAATGVATSTDACGMVAITESETTVLDCGNTEVITRTWLATDACGNTDSCVQTITVVDNTAPEISCPANALVECGSDTGSASTGMATATDACGAVTITESDSSVSTCGNTEIITRTWLATDACGNTDSCVQTITVTDTTDPIITCPPGQMGLTCNSVLPDPINAINDFIVSGGTIIEGCSATSISSTDSSDPSTFSFCAADGPFVVIRTYTVTDACGNTGQCTQSFAYVADTEGPSFSCGANLTVNTNVGECTAMVTIAVPTPTDNCTADADITLVNDMNGMADASGDYPVGTTTIIWTATDNCGNTSTCAINIIVNDNEDPEVTCPEDISIECDISEAPAATTIAEFEAQGGVITDNCMDATLTISHTDVSDNNTCPEIITRTYTFTQGDLSISCDQLITINDDTPPVLSCGADFTINTDAGLCTAMATIAVPTAIDNCEVSSLVNDMNGMADASGNYPVGTTPITWTATDACGNTATCLVNLSVMDNIPPTIMCPDDLTAMCSIGDAPAATTIAELEAQGGSADDNCDMDLSISSVDVSDGNMCPEQITRTYTVTDDTGLTATCVQIITVDDTTLPVITCPADMTVECGGDTSIAAMGTATATDNCTADAMILIVSSDESVPACATTEVITRTWTATDACGNVVTCDQTITVQDNINPVLTVPTNLVLECDGDYDVEITSWLASASATDGCSTPTVTNDYVVGTLPTLSCDQSTGLTVTFTAVDDCGNTDIETATIILDDTIAPTITCPSDLVLECDGEYGAAINAWLLTATAVDGCNISSITTDYVPGTLPMVSCDASEGLEVTFTATDDCGNTATCTAEIIITDTVAPVITCPANVIDLTCEDELPAGASLPNDFVAFQGGTIVEDCSSVTVSFEDDLDPENLDFCIGSDLVITRTYTISDECGNAATCQQTFTYLPDTEAPVLDCSVVADITLECGDAENDAAVVDWLADQAQAILDAATDDCGDMTVTNNYVTGTYPSETICCSNPAMSGLLVTFIVEDECGNTSTCAASILLDDSLPPLLDCSKVSTPLVLECEAMDQATTISNWLTTMGDFLLSTSSDQCILASNVLTVTNDYDGTTIPDVSCDQSTGLTINFTVTDCCGNSASCASQIIVDDTMLPTITCPADLVLECGDDANFDSLITDWLDTAMAEDACGDVTITNDYDGTTIPVFNCDLVDGVLVTFTATDDCDNEFTCTASIFQSDTTDPELSCPNNLILGCDGDYETEIMNWIATASATDICDTDVDITNDFVAGMIPPLSCDLSDGIMITFVATDDCGNTDGCTAMMYLDDNFDPDIECPSNLILECDGDYETEINEWLATVTATDGCDASVTITNDYTAGDLPALSCDQSTGLTVTFTATDDCGNEDTCTATIIIDDTILPVITCPTDLTLECDGEYEAEINAWLAMISATDLCDSDLVITNDYTAGDLPDLSCDLSAGLVVTFTATDDCDNMGECTATIFLNDTVDPMISCPADLTLECDGEYTDEINTWIALVSGSDACDTDVEITDDYDGSIPEVSCDLSSGLAVAFTATDECGNTATCVRTIFINDTMDPEIIDPAMDVTIECDGSSDPLMDFADWLANAGNSDVEDACDDMLVITNTSIGLSNDCGITGTETVTFTFTDACDNTVSTTATFTITDNTPPEITVEAMDLKVECSDISFDDSVQDWLDDNGGAVAEDACGSVVWTNDSNGILDDCNGTGFMFVTFTATDECGNTATTQATFTAGDETPPEVNTEAMDMTVECDGTPDPSGAFATWLANNAGAIANDICGDVTWTNNSMGLSDDCGATGSETVVFTATDDCGNSATTQATFTIEDTTNPEWVLAPTNMTVECDGTPDPSGAFATWLLSFTGMDTCGDVVITNNSIGLSDDCGATGSELVTFTLTDDCGNFITADATFTIEDTTDPEWVMAPMDVTLECDGIDPTDAFNAWLTSWTGTDVCGDVMLTNNSIGLSDECGMTGSETVTFTLTDDCGNFITADATFTIVDTTNPIIDPMAMDMTVECDGTPDPSGAFATWLSNNGGAVATDACGMVTWSNNSMGLSDDCGATGSETVVFTATDECGNESTTQATFTIEDTTAPVIDPMAMDMTVECDGTLDPSGAFAAWLATNGGADATDACGTFMWTNNSVGLSDDCGATGSETVTFTVTDECGNTSITQATFAIVDTTDPVIDPVAMDMTVECDGTPDPSGAFATWLSNNGGALATDACGMVTWSNNSVGLSDDCGATGSETVIFTATDDCGNTTTTQATFTIEDNIDPVISPTASDMTVECDGTLDPSGAFAAWLADIGGARATDLCGAVSWSNNSMGLSDDCGATGTETVTFTATDECGNTSITQATFTIEDTTDPAINPIASDMTVECDGSTDPGGAFAAWLADNGGAAATDLCGNVMWSNNSSGLSDDCGATGTETVIFTATDECGNTSTTQATFTIEDTTAPDITCPTLLPFGTNATTCDSDVVIDTPVTNDACGTVSIAWVASNGTMGAGNASATYPIGLTTVTYTATDECGNTSTCAQDILVLDNVGPALACTSAQCLILDNDGQVTVPATSFVASVTDNCGVIASTQAMIVGSGNAFADNVSFDCNSKGLLMVMVEVTDDSGNTTQCTVEVTLKDNIDPSLDASIAGNNICLPNVTINCEYPLDTVDLTPLGTIVFDATNQNDIVINGVIVGQDGIFTDNCDAGLFILSDTSDDSGVDPQCNVGDLVRTIIVSDASGNTTACVQTITIMDENPFTCDEVTWPADYTADACPFTITDPAITGTPAFVIDKCSLVGTNHVDMVFDSPLSGCPYIERTWTLIDWCQYDANDPATLGICTYTQVLTYVNDVPPTILNAQDTMICANPNTCIGEVNLVLLANDDCTDSLDLAISWRIDVNGDGISFINGIGNTLVGNFPQGDHVLRWTVEDRCGNSTVSETSMLIRDCKAPGLICKFGLSTTLLPKNNGCVVIWASDFVKSVEDNCTDLSDIAISFSADTTDTNKKFTCLDMGDQTVEIWATDSNGNQTFCTTVIDIQDNLNVCPDAGAELRIAGELRTEMGDPIEAAEVTVEGSEMEEMDMSDDSGIYAFENLPSSDDYMVIPYKNDDAINGVSTIDLVLIQKHILGLAELDSPYKLIAADANNSQSISAIDLIEIRKLILGIYNKYPNNTSWRFVDQEFQFADPTEPWPFMEEVMNSDMNTDQMEVDFVGVKIGDVNNTVEASADKVQSSNRSGKALDLVIEDQAFKAGDIVKVDVKSKDFLDIIGLQYTLNVDATKLSYIATESAILNVTELNVGLPTADQLTFSWNTLEGKSVADSEILYRVSFIAHTDGTLGQSIDLNSSITSAEAYDANLETIDLSMDLVSSNVYATLYQNNPNPFSSYTDVSFEISKSQEVELTIYGADGKNLWNSISTYPQGLNTVQVSYKEIGAVSGVLYLEMKADKFIATKKMILLK